MVGVGFMHNVQTKEGREVDVREIVQEMHRRWCGRWRGSGAGNGVRDSMQDGTGDSTGDSAGDGRRWCGDNERRQEMVGEAGRTEVWRQCEMLGDVALHSLSPTVAKENMRYKAYGK